MGVQEKDQLWGGYGFMAEYGHCVHAAGNGGQHFDEEGAGAPQPPGGNLRQEHRRPDPQGDGDEQADSGGDHGAVNKRQSAEILKDGVPGGGDEKPPSEFVPGER